MSKLKEAVERYDGMLDYCYDGGDYPTASEERHIQDLQVEVVKAARDTVPDIDVLELIIKKKVDVKLVMWAEPSLEAYNVHVNAQKDYWKRDELTKEEFNSIVTVIRKYTENRGE